MFKHFSSVVAYRLIGILCHDQILFEHNKGKTFLGGGVQKRGSALRSRNVGSLKSVMRRPGVEPGSTAWKATMLAITPPTLVDLIHLTLLLNFSCHRRKSSMHLGVELNQSLFGTDCENK